MSGRLGHQLTDEGVMVVLRPQIGSPSSLRVTPDEAKRFAWSILADVDPEGQVSPSEAPIKVGALCIDMANATVSAGGCFIHFTKSELKALECLARHHGQCVSKDRMLDWIYGNDDDAPCIKIITVFICKIRKKLAAAGHGGLIETSWGNGFRLLAEPRDPFGPRSGTGGKVNGDEGRPRRTPQPIQVPVLRRLGEGPATFRDLRELNPAWSVGSVRGVVFRLLADGRAENIGDRRSAVYVLGRANLLSGRAA
jgi:DNA-binding winged helix-turn-helix (wHTH) protein